MQHRLKPTTGPTGTRIIATELFDKLLVSIDDAIAALDPGFRWESFATFARYLKTSTG
jgi:hypothetical protein